ncbi:MAG: hypothetical protein A2902_05380 [Elusimicrobia bacterium RIFCSPLOWO2_01_FULL_64_13]|nr:MAG: hypothetical protein A2636_00975 [Elusimicrobia bacterium RIFCSPHIGHO2_01_FULL_64_10]OGR94553.1 MAG: hypothetical protein A2902_05380 [Elusimicrobia bacterium RIFCSPLOWO2_01_FULL_64_13]
MNLNKVLIVSIAAGVLSAGGNARTETMEGGRIFVAEPLVVTANRLATPPEEVASSFYVITREEIEAKQKSSVLELLRGAPALDVVQSGGAGKTTSIFIRGANSEHTLVMLDGVEMNDPMSAGRSYDFAHLGTENIDRIEIIRGPQSTLYGSDALGGVINIITRRGENKIGITAVAEGGSFETYRQQVDANGGNPRLNYSLGVSRVKTSGISSALAGGSASFEKDGYENTSLSTRFGLTPSESFDFETVFKFFDAKADIDNGAAQDDPNHRSNAREVLFKSQAGLKLFDEAWKQKLSFSLSDHHQDVDNGFDADHPNDRSSTVFDSRLYRVDWQNDLQLHEANTLTLGLEAQEERGESDSFFESSFGTFTSNFGREKARTNGLYVQDQLKLWDSFFATLGGRVDDHERFGSKTTYRFGSAYVFQPTSGKVKGTYGTGFKAPSLFQLHSAFGDKDLRPEESIGWDVGLEQPFFDERASLGAAYFRNDFKDLIDFDPAASRYANTVNARSSGVEAFAQARPFGPLRVRLDYTHTSTENKSTGQELLRRPRNKFGASSQYNFPKRQAYVNLGVVFVGRRDDLDFDTGERVRLKDYTLVNLAGGFETVKNFKLFGRIENLLDQKYEEVAGFGTPGISGFAGVKWTY